MLDFNLHNGSPVLETDIDLVLQQIDLLFDTVPREVLGSEEFGTTYDDMLYDLQLSGPEIKRQVENDLNSLDLLGFGYSVDVHLLQGTEQDIALIEIVLTKDEQSYNRVYKIS